MSFCQHCVDLKELPGTPQGSEQKIAGVQSYVAEGSKKGSIVIATDIFGNGVTNPKVVADIFAKKTGYSVYVPDIFPGGPIDPKDFTLPNKASDGPPSDETMQGNFAKFGEWMEKGNSPDKAYERFSPVVKELGKSGSVGVVGYCYGAKMAVLAAIDKSVKAIALYHASLLEADEASKVTVPTLLNEAELEPLFTGDLKKTWEDTLKSNGLLDKRTKEYPNTVHGFGVRPDMNDAKVKAGFEESVDATSAFFTEVLG